MTNEGSESYRKQVGSRIHQLRVSQGLSLRKLALMVGMDYAYLSNIEHGTANPTIGSLERLADGLGIDLRDLFI